MPWPPKVVRQSLAIRPNPSENEFHGPYNKLLYTLFPADSDFTVVPQYLQQASSKAADYIVTFEVFFETRPVFILGLKKPSDINFISARHAADQQIRERMADLVCQCPIATLHAVSALGTRLCFYQLGDNDALAEITPQAIPRHPTRVNDTAPAERWDCDILEAEGEATLRGVVNQIMEACEGIAEA